MSSQIIIAAQPKCYRFSSEEGKPGEKELIKRLRAQDSTEPVEIRRPEDVMLNKYGRVQKEYQLTTTSLSQLCSTLAPGLSQYVANMAGLRQKEGGEDDWGVFSPISAIKAVNEAIRQRFEHRLVGHGLIIDLRNKRVEGVVGPRYRFFSNSELLARCNEFAASLDPPARFYAASLAGRRLILRYRGRRLFVLGTPHDKKEPFYVGWHFANSEIGDCSVRTGFALIRQWSRTVGLLPVGRLVHLKGGGFGPRLTTLIEQLRRKEEEIVNGGLAECAEQTISERLDLIGDEVARAKRAAVIAGRLARGKLSKQLAKKAVNQALLCGSYKADRISAHRGLLELNEDALARFRSRTVYDLYNALGVVAKTLLPEQQEIAEETAFKLFTGRIKLP